MEIKPIGLYIHIPFCKRKCNYCDFCSTVGKDGLMDRYTKALLLEIAGYKQAQKIKIDTLYIGGGTPSLLPAHLFKSIYDAVKSVFDICYDNEFTVEVNPGTLTEEKLLLYKECGVNRISLGLQSIHENEMKILGRIHDYDDFLRSYNMIFDRLTKNINVDLMYGIPEQTRESFDRTLRAVTNLRPAHISAYGLIVEDGTPFFEKRETLNFPNEEAECDMYYTAHRLLCSEGYEHYEISNYAKRGYRSRHNLKYWHDEEYIGIGLSAHSYYHGKRYSNTDDFSAYFDNPCAKYSYTDARLDKDPAEYAMLALRLDEGFSLDEYKSLFGKDFTEGKEKLLKLYRDIGLMRIEDGRIALTEKGFYVSNTLMSELIDFEA